MKNVNITLAVVAALAAVTVFVSSTHADAVLPPGLAPGSQYQIMFVTSDGIAATSSTIGDYNSFVTTEANESPTLAGLAASNVTWTAVVSTPTFNANQASTATVPIYDTSGSGIPLEPNFLSLFSDSNFTGPQYDQYGSSVYSPSKLSTMVWTGSNSGGYAQEGDGWSEAMGALGSGVAYGEDGDDNHFWLWYSPDSPSSLLPVYAISSPITIPVPEPGTLTLLVSALLGLAGAFYLRRRRATA